MSCQSTSSFQQITVEKIAECFINPASCDFDALNAEKDVIKEWDSLVDKAVRTHALKAGIFTTLFRDSFNAEYTLGYATPSNIRTDTTYPLIIYLHGGTGSTLTTKGEKAYDMLRPLADTFELFLASPSANRSTPWWSPGGMSRILQTLRFMTLHYPINPDKVFLAGVSDGATGCYAAANTIPSPFAGFVAVSGFGGMLTSVAMSLFPSNIMQRPLYNINAGKDRIYNIKDVNLFLDWLMERGAQVLRKEYPDELHGFDYRSKEFGTLANYIRTWVRPSDTRGVNWTAVQGFPNCADNLIGFTMNHSSPTCHINACWKNDTLEIASEGLSEAILSFPAINKEKIIVRVNKQKPRSIRALPAKPSLSYRMMMHACFPIIHYSACYRINFK